MRRWAIFGAVALFLFGVAGVVLTFIPKLRDRANLAGCQHNLREVGLFAAHFSGPQPKQPRKAVDLVPAGTIVLPGVPPEDRLSWYVTILPGLDQKRQAVGPLLAGIDEKQPWSADPNQAAARTRLLVAICPGNPAAVIPDQPAPAQYVGIAGLGADAATLALPPPPAKAPPRAGCFRYDAPTPFEAITDGLSQTLLLGERSGDVGPWLRGGPGTVRGLDDSPGAKPLLGTGGQFGGNHPDGSNWLLADGSVRVFTDRTDPKLLYSFATIAGKDSDPIPGE